MSYNITSIFTFLCYTIFKYFSGKEKSERKSQQVFPQIQNAVGKHFNVVIPM